MTVDVAQQVTSCKELSAGDKIEAWHNGKLFHLGEVLRTVADTDLFWILDERTGTRKLIDAEVLVIRRVAVQPARRGSDAKCGSETEPGPAAAHRAARGSAAVHGPAAAHGAAHGSAAVHGPAPTDHSKAAGSASGRPASEVRASEAPAPAVPASHVPLFQAPGPAG